MPGWKTSATPTQKRNQPPEFKDRTILEVYQEERASLMELRGTFDGIVEKAVSHGREAAS